MHIEFLKDELNRLTESYQIFRNGFFALRFLYHIECSTIIKNDKNNQLEEKSELEIEEDDAEDMPFSEEIPNYPFDFEMEPKKSKKKGNDKAYA